MNTLVIYHGPHCIDGFTSGWIAHVACERMTPQVVPELYPMDYEEKEEEKLLIMLASNPEYYDLIYVLDFSLRIELMKRIIGFSSCAKIVVIDHHKSAFNMYFPLDKRTPEEVKYMAMENGRIKIYLHNAKSGAGMCWTYFFPNEDMPLLVKHVQDRDIWTKEIPNTDAIHKYLMGAHKSISSWTEINAAMCHDSTYQKIVAEGDRLLDIYMEKVAAYADLAEDVDVYKHRGMMVKCDPDYASDVGHALCKKSGTFGMTYSETADGEQLKISLRSEGDYDVEIIAKHYGGGGHKNAAGFVVPPDALCHGELL